MRAAVLGLLAACGRFGFQPDTAPGDTNLDSPADADTGGLVAAWAMDSVAGDVVVDASGHGHDATCSSAAMSCPVLVAGKHGNALRFDGVNDHLDAAGSGLDTINAFTITAWVWIDAPPPTSYYCFANKLLGVAQNDSWQACVTQSRSIYFGTGNSPTTGGDDVFSNPSSVPITAWCHVAIRWDGSFKTIWLDGVNVVGQQASVTFDGSPLELGYDIDNGAPVAPFAGILDEVRIYNRALSDGEIALLAQ